jgi:hypothetical protein
LPHLCCNSIVYRYLWPSTASSRRADWPASIKFHATSCDREVCD